MFHRFLWRLRYQIRCVLADYPSLYFNVYRFMKNRDHRGEKITRDKELVLEGFPRSGNSFAYAAFVTAQKRPVRVAHHLHAPAQVILSARWNIPTLVIVRNPLDAVTSFLIRHPEIIARQSLRAWIRYHRRLESYQQHFVVATFSQIIGDFGSVIGRLNERFGKSFLPFHHSDDHVAECFRFIEAQNAHQSNGGSVNEKSVARPSSARLTKKKMLLQTMQRIELGSLREEAGDLFERYSLLAGD